MREDVRGDSAVVNEFVEWHGDFSDRPIFHQPISYGISVHGVKSKPDHWHPWSGTIAQSLASFTTHRQVSDKDTYCLIQGSKKRGRRLRENMIAMHLMMLDMDTGESREAIIARLIELGWMAAVYTTFSHLKPITKKKRHQLVKLYGPDAGFPEMLDWLSTVKRYQPAILEGAEFLGENDEGEFVIRHAPMPKFEVVLYLSEPFSCEGGDRQEEWRELYFGVSAMLGAYVDRACSDFSRLMYAPSRPFEQSEYHVDLIAGECLDLSTVTPVPLLRGAVGRVRRVVTPRTPKDRPDGAYEQALASEPSEFATSGMRRFLGKHGKTFRVVDFIRDAKPLWIRGRASEGMTIQCPGEDDHSESGGSGCYAVNGTGKKGFIINCRHDSCQGRDRADFLDLLCDEVNITNVNQLKGYV